MPSRTTSFTRFNVWWRTPVSASRDRALTGADPGGVGDAAQQHASDEVAGPLQDCRVAQRLATYPSRHRLRHQNGMQRVVDERLRVEPQQPQLGRFGEVDR